VPAGFIMASRSVEIPEIPEVQDKVRAQLHIAGARFRPAPDASKTLCDIVMSVDLKGNIPKGMAEQVIPTIMAIDVESNTKHFKEL
ncbi:hypothetical protein PFISCL1PPCAC_13397, partial [Pristionchus fissidentatus]